MMRRNPTTPGVPVRTRLYAGAIQCYDNSTGVLTPVWTPCNTPPYPSPIPPTPGVQWLSCNACSGARLADGSLSNASCDVCYT